MKKDNNYIIKGGEDGKSRLDVIAEILNGYTKELIKTNGVISGKKFLDIGSGGGSVALMVADMVGHTGSVTAIDFDAEIIELAKVDAKNLNINNISYLTLDAYKLNYDAEFDIAYTRFLLSHLQNPEIVLEKMINSLKPGGVIIIEDIDFSGHFCYPNSEAFDLYLNFFVKASTKNGQNPNIGLQLVKLFKDELRLDNAEFDVIQPFYNNGVGKWMAYLTMDRIKETILEQGLADEITINRVLLELRQFTEDQNSIISLPRIFRIKAIKRRE